MNWNRPLIIAIFLLSAGYSLAQEVIRNYDVEVEVLTDRSVKVTEVIIVNVEGINIQRGIFREISNVLLDDDGKKYRYPVDVLEVTRNGNTEPYDASVDGNAATIRIGDADHFLNSGEHTYKIVYTMKGQVRFFDDFDEVYWNAIGTFWDFTIEQASVLVTLQSDAEIRELNAYSGAKGTGGPCDCESHQLNSHTAAVKMTRSLAPNEGLTVSLTWNKGIVPEPSPEEVLSDRTEIIPVGKMTIYILYGGLLIVFVYYYLIWKRVGVDPKKGTIIPRWEPPKGLSPGPVRYIREMGYDNEVFASSIISIAIKRHIDIKMKDKTYVLKRIKSEKAQSLSSEEQIIVDELYGDDYISIEVDQANHSLFGKALTAYRKEVKKVHKKPNFTKNYGWLFPGILLSLATLIGAMSQVNDPIIPVFFFLIALEAVFLFALFRAKKRVSRIVLLFFAGFLLIPLVIIYFAEGEFAINDVLPFIPGLLALGGMNYLFGYLLPAPTVQGRKTMDEIEGLKMYMTTAEKNRLNMMNPPKENLSLFEDLFPYALALGVQQKWSERFEDMLLAMQYQPDWYHGDFNRAHMALFATSLGSSFTTSLSAASAPPQSSGSSGSGGGGFSGGGGGGGGGGGW